MSGVVFIGTRVAGFERLIVGCSGSRYALRDSAIHGIFQPAPTLIAPLDSIRMALARSRGA
jgi:hypothetical protein